MARRLRIQFEGALYHVINRGNYRRDLFETVGAAHAFLVVLDEAVRRYAWRLHAYVLMRNHYHLALETVQPNLVEGMHWLQSTIATRFNRFRRENGHLFQGRYQAILLEDAAVLRRVVHYIHLNPVRAKVVMPEQVAQYRWSSLHRLLRDADGAPPVITTAWWTDNTNAGGNLTDYLQRLIEVGRDEAAQEAAGLTGLSRGWAMGTAAWRRAVAEDQSQRPLTPGLSRAEVQALKEARWQAALERGLQRLGKQPEELVTRRRGERWKIELARQLRREVGASPTWLAKHLHLGTPGSVRSYLARKTSGKNQQFAA